jgi:hypothetical protein
MFFRFVILIRHALVEGFRVWRVGDLKKSFAHDRGNQFFKPGDFPRAPRRPGQTALALIGGSALSYA